MAGTSHSHKVSVKKFEDRAWPKSLTLIAEPNGLPFPDE